MDDELESHGLIQNSEGVITRSSTTKLKIEASRFWLLFSMVVIFAVAFTGGYFLGKGNGKNGKGKNSEHHPSIDFHKFVQDNLKASEIEQNLRYAIVVSSLEIF